MKAMGAPVRKLHNANGRWKHRKAVPLRLRSHIVDSITESVRRLGAGVGQPSPQIVRLFGAAEAECAGLIATAEKRAAGQFDDIGQDVIAHIIAHARSEMLEEDVSANSGPTARAPPRMRGCPSTASLPPTWEKLRGRRSGQAGARLKDLRHPAAGMER